jgi:elongation factor P hydroxylase
MHHSEDIITIFNKCFLETHNTRLVKGDDEPIYLPADQNRPYNELFFAHGFFASALHESSHWMIAGNERRTQIDFGYWYVPDGRTAAQQEAFLHVEVKPQALEWIFSLACGFDFRVSLDNLNGLTADIYTFKFKIHEQVKEYCEKGLPARAVTFRQALCHFYGTPHPLSFKDFDLSML